ncbi:MAG: DUF4160 domain-containing protein [Thermoleophilaceae bacterium]
MARPPASAFPRHLRWPRRRDRDRVAGTPQRLAPPRALRLVKEWAATHRDELRENWDRARVHEALEPIDPLP